MMLMMFLSTIRLFTKALDITLAWIFQDGHAEKAMDKLEAGHG
jgi:hypothetical protein